MNQSDPAGFERRGSGCAGRGCLFVFGFLLLLTLAFVGGGFWAVRHFRDTYSASQPLTFAQLDSAEGTALRGPTELSRPRLPRDSSAPDNDTAEPAETVTELQKRWRRF